MAEIECSHIFSIMFCGNERGGEEDIGYFLFCENLLLFRHFGGGWFRDSFDDDNNVVGNSDDEEDEEDLPL